MFTRYIARCQYDGLSAFACLGDWSADIRASLAHTICDAIGSRNRPPAGDSVDAEAEPGEAGNRVCKCAANGAEPGALRAAAPGAVARRERSAARNPRAHGLRAAADSAQHLCGD